MLNKNYLKGKMVENGLNQGDLAKAIGISGKTLYLKLNNNSFNCDEMDKIVDILHLNGDDALKIFFTQIGANSYQT